MSSRALWGSGPEAGQTRLSRLPWAVRNEYRIVRVTLTPVSRRQIFGWLRRLGEGGGRIVDDCLPAPGFVRLIIRKLG